MYCGLGGWFVCGSLLDWTWQEWFFKPAYFNPYTTLNVVSPWADFAFFTYISLILFCIWAILRFVAILFNLKKLIKFADNSYVVLFVCLNQFIVLLLYTAMQLVSGQNFGYYASDAYAIKSFVTNLIVHYLFTSAAVVYFFIHEHGKIEFKKCLLFLPFIAVYGVTVKLTGMYCYVFEWYPYPFFSAESMWFNLFGSLQDFNKTHAILMIVLAISIIVVVYLTLIFWATKYVNKRQNRCKN